MAREGDLKFCEKPGCGNRFACHRWGAIEAHRAGWFHQKDGRSWCPEHLPDWLPAWRVYMVNKET